MTVKEDGTPRFVKYRQTPLDQPPAAEEVEVLPMAKWLKAGGAIPNHPGLKTDLATPTYSFNAAGKLVLESKDEIKKRGLRSSDVADSLCLTFAYPIAPKATSIWPRGRHQSEWDPFQEAFRRADRPFDHPSHPSNHKSEWNPLGEMANRVLGR